LTDYVKDGTGTTADGRIVHSAGAPAPATAGNVLRMMNLAALSTVFVCLAARALNSAVEVLAVECPS
jgi:hypothetical protein